LVKNGRIKHIGMYLDTIVTCGCHEKYTISRKWSHIFSRSQKCCGTK
jgi:hypothetical protein